MSSQAPSALFLLDAQGSVASWNDVAAEITGYSAARVLGSSLFMMFEPGTGELKVVLEQARELGHGQCRSVLWHGAGRECEAVLQLARVGGPDELHGEFICSVRVVTPPADPGSASVIPAHRPLADAPLLSAVRYASDVLDEIASLSAAIGDLRQSLASLEPARTPPEDPDS